jgi:hypothetical protein
MTERGVIVIASEARQSQGQVHGEGIASAGFASPATT